MSSWRRLTIAAVTRTWIHGRCSRPSSACSRICVGYEVDGDVIDYLPLDLAKAKPVYKSFPGWERTEGIREWDALPEAAKTYLNAIEALTETKIGMVRNNFV